MIDAYSARVLSEFSEGCTTPGDVGVTELVNQGMDSPQDLARLAMITLLEDRRIATAACAPTGVCEPCIEPHVKKLTPSVEEGEPMQLMLVGFPCKSPSPDKVLGDLPDMAEIISLGHINSWAQRIGSFYEPGAEIIIGADGRALADLVEVNDTTVSGYVKCLRDVIDAAGLSIRYVGLDEFLPDLAEGENYTAMRDALDDNAVHVSTLRERCQADPDFAYEVNGIERFLAEDLRPFFPELSRNKLCKLARQRAYEIIARGEALRAELDVRFPRAARLSIHPQKSHTGKLGVQITRSREDWMTPWHGAAIRKPGEGFRLIKSAEARALGARVVNFETVDRPSYFDLSVGAAACVLK
jgi:pyoverdine/dityrosine biosynthesis protein Dit1